jgi:NTE family protein
VRATEFGIDETPQDTLFKSGRRTAKKFLDGWDFERDVKEFRTDQEQEPVSSEAPAMAEI